MNEWWGLTTSTAPWWFVVAVSGLLGIAGVISGAIVSYKSVKASDERRNAYELARTSSIESREDRQRWYDKMRDVSARFVVTAHKLQYRGGETAVSDYVKYVENDIDPRSADADDKMDSKQLLIDLLNKVDAAGGRIQELAGIRAELDLIAPDDVRSAAGKVFKTAIWLARPSAMSQVRFDNANLQDRQIQEFIGVVRRHITPRPSQCA